MADSALVALENVLDLDQSTYFITDRGGNDQQQQIQLLVDPYALVGYVYLRGLGPEWAASGVNEKNAPLAVRRSLASHHRAKPDCPY